MTTNQILTAMQFKVEDLENSEILKSIQEKWQDEDRSKDFDVVKQIDASRLFFDYN
jgi:hypothetical protein